MERPSDTTGDRPPTRDTNLVFRVVEVDGVRRGIRLEAVYWQVLKEIADARQKKIGALVGVLLADAPQSANATSLLRVHCLRWALDKLAAERRITDPSGIANLVRASPGPAFALGPDRQLVAYNQPFLGYIQARFPTAETEPVNRDLRLALDVQLSALAAILKESGNRPLGVGFTVGFGGRRVRGQLNALLAPASDRTVILCYVLP